MKIKKRMTNNNIIIILLKCIILTLLGTIIVFLVRIYETNLFIDNLDNSINNRLETVKFDKLIQFLIKKRPVYVTIPGVEPILAIREDYLKDDSIWKIVNKQNKLSTDYIPNNLVIPNVATRTDKSNDERSIRSDIEKPLTDMFAAAKMDGYELMIGSGYRSASLQAIYFNSLANSIGAEAANQSIARPGESEHQTGLAIDISTISYECYLDNCFAYTSGGQWLAKNSYKYGFILRYPENKTEITGYRYESWHFRYVGIGLATALYESGLTLDEAWGYLKTAQETLEKNGAI